MADYQPLRIGASAEKCTGCHRCQLACSFQFTKRFNPASAYLGIHRTFEETISFLPECTECELCVDACTFGALYRKEG